MSLFAMLLPAALASYALTPFAELGQSVDELKLEDTNFEKVSESREFIKGGLATEGGTFLVYIRFPGWSRKIQNIELISSTDYGPINGRDAKGNCTWLKKKLVLAYGEPSYVEPTEYIRKIFWRGTEGQVLISYWETTSLDKRTSCGSTAEVIR